MSENEPKSPFIHVKIHISRMDTQKQLGLLKQSVEVTFGNLETVEIRDKNDIADVIKSSKIADKVWDEWDAVTKKFEGKGYHFIKEKENTQ